MHRSILPAPVIPALGLSAFVLEHAYSYASRPALIDGGSGETLTYAELADRVAAAARALRAARIGPGSTVALVSPNQPWWAVAFHAVVAAGATLLPLNPALTVSEMTHLLDASGAVMVIADGAVVEKAEAAAQPGGLTLWTIGLPVTGWPSLARESQRHSVAAAAPLDIDPATAVAALPYSSGTTGLPKGVMLTHRNLVANICQHAGVYVVGTTDVFLAVLPFFHIYGITMVMNCGLRHGATIVTMPRFDPDRYLAAIGEHRVTWLHLAPPMVLRLGDEDFRGDLSSVRRALSGAAPLDDAVARRAQARIGCPIRQGYGMTEAGPGVTFVPDDRLDSAATGSVGVLLAGTEARVVDPLSGEDSDGAGEMWVRGPQVMAGYLDEPRATAATIGPDGWLRTGDIVRVDERGNWRVIDRLKELIKYKGYQVAPAELEAVLLSHPRIADAAVVGVADAAAGEVPKAFVVVRRDGAGDLGAEALMAWVAARVAPYKKVRAVEFREQIPRSAAGKILRRELRAPATPPT